MCQKQHKSFVLLLHHPSSFSPESVKKVGKFESKTIENFGEFLLCILVSHIWLVSSSHM